MDELQRKSPEEFILAEKNKIIVVLENIRSAYNVGSVFRTADAFLLNCIHLCGYTAYPPHKEIKKTALGADETVNWKRFDNAKNAIEDLRSDGYQIFAIEQAENSIALNKYEFPDQPNKKIALIFGNEVKGVEQSTIECCDGCIEIPQLGMKHSLNISVAAGIVLWEILRTRMGSD
jgi:tRNA G18 (ribose-2'-O)-methylase SpoU